jgi:hypothetical protein
MTNPDGTHVDLSALTNYSSQLGYYSSEADRFGAVIDQADVTDEAWGLIGIWAKQSYTDRLSELRSLLAEMKEGVGDLTTKVTDSVAVYQGNEDDKVIEFGQYEANIDGPR